ncbi:MAG TPA: tRNA dihydrouridine synthase DusB [Ilumatobacteraceae bacterium]|nr:tRNA dihydrouridine synthase DusB [Ilumatobacteraceae bacterium]
MLSTAVDVAPLQLGQHSVWPPVVLAPMAGVTNAAFRTMCRRFGPGLVYVNEMVMATALVHGSAKTDRMATFGPGDTFRSLQVYGSDPVMVGEAVRRLVDADRVDHIDLNFGCPANKVTRRGGGAAVPVKPNLLRAILRAVVVAASPAGVPVTAKFRMGIDDDLLTFVRTGQIAEDEGLAAIALHARTAQQHYAGEARWDAIGELKAAVSSIPVLGNGDIWEAADAVAMIDQTGCDGVVVGRGCLGRPWLFGNLIAAFSGAEVPPSPPLGFVAQQMADHCRLLADLVGEDNAVRDFRKHTSWYLTGYPVGGETRGRFSRIASLAELDDLLAALDPTMTVVPGGERIRRGHTNGPIRVVLPHGDLDDLDDATPPDDGDVTALSGG